MSSESTSSRQVHRRIPKACEPCRRRKTKCSGGQAPCPECLRGPGAEGCHYREKPRIRTAHRVRTVTAELPTSTNTISFAQPDQREAEPEPDPDPEADFSDSDEHLYTNAQGAGAHQGQGVNAAHFYSQLYYGTSSNFAFLQHIHQTFSQPDARQNGQTGSFDRFKHRERFFASDNLVRGIPDSVRARFLLLPEPLARQFLQNFLSSIHHLIPFITGDRLHRLLERLYDPNPPKPLNSSDTAILLLALATGATLTRHTGWVDQLIDRARSEVPSLEHVVNLKSVQIALMISHSHAACGRPNSAYLQLGTAARKAFAAGLHKDVDYQPNMAGMARRAEVRRLTFWSLVIFERWVSFWLGRPSAMDGPIFSTPYPESNPLIRALADLSGIVVQATHRMYDDAQLPPAKLWEAAQHIRLELHGFQRRTEPELGFNVDGTSPIGHVDQVFMMNFLFHVWILTFRPFLIISMTWNRARFSSEPNASASGPSSLPVDMWWLPEACGVAVGNARKLISFFASSVQQSIIVRGLVFSTSYMESACCLLFYDSIRDHSAIETNMASIREGLASLGQMLDIGPIPGIISTLKQLLTELEQVRSSESNSLTVSEPLGLISRVSNPNDIATAMGMEPSLSAMEPMMPVPRQPQFVTGLQHESGLLDMNWPPFFSYDNRDLDQSLFAPNLTDYFNPGPTAMLS